MHTATLDNYSNNLLGTFKPSQYHKNEVEEKCNSISAVVESSQGLTNKTEFFFSKKDFTVKNLTDIIQVITVLLCQVTSNNFLNCDYHQ